MLFRPFTMPNFCVDEAITVPVYQGIKIYSNSFINNAKEELLVYFLVIFLSVIIIILSKFTSSPFIANLKKHVKYSVIIRLHLVFYLDFMTFSMINVYFYSGQNSCSSSNLGFSLFFLVVGAS